MAMTKKKPQTISVILAPIDFSCAACMRMWLCSSSSTGCRGGVASRGDPSGCSSHQLGALAGRIGSLPPLCLWHHPSDLNSRALHPSAAHLRFPMIPVLPHMG